MKLITEIPGIYWLVMLMSSFIHLLMKIQMDSRANKVALKSMFTSFNTLITIIISFTCSVTLLIMGYSGYVQYLAKHPDADNPFIVLVVVAMIGYTSSSLFLNLMGMTEKFVLRKLGLSDEKKDSDEQ